MWRTYFALLRKPAPAVRFYSATKHPPQLWRGLQSQDLDAVNTHIAPLGKIQEALDRNLFALAAMIAVRHPEEPLPLEAQHEIARGLSRFHPRLTPVNFMALQKLSIYTDLELQSVDKALLLQTLISYGDQQLFLQGLELVHNIKGGPIPISAIMRAVQFAYTSCQLRSCESLWNYIKAHYMVHVPKYTTLMTDLMKTFARAKDYQPLALEIAQICLVNAENPGIALSIAKVAYVLRDRTLVKALIDAPNFQLSREVRGALTELDAMLGTLSPATIAPLSHDELTDQEFSGVVKGTATRDFDEAESLAESRSGLNATILAKIALANQLIEDKDETRFREAITDLEQFEPVRGIMLNLRLKWESKHGSFRWARRHYQNFRNVPLRQRVIALNTLSSLAAEESEIQWVLNERQLLASLKVKARSII